MSFHAALLAVAALDITVVFLCLLFFSSNIHISIGRVYMYVAGH